MTEALRARKESERKEQQMRIVIGNLPDGVTEDGVREALKVFAPVGNITLAKGTGTPSAVIEMEMTRGQADALARRIHGHIFEGRDLRAWVPLRD